MRRRSRNAAAGGIGCIGGMGLGLLAVAHPQWIAAHPGTVLLGVAVAVVLAICIIQRHMNAFERDHEARVDAFRFAMLAEFAPDRLDQAGVAS